MADELILCATARLAQSLRATPPSATATVWRTLPALTLAQWLAGLADEARLSGLADLPQALDPFAEQLLWEQVIAGTLDGAAELFDIRGMAASAAEAHALCQVWRLSPGGPLAAEESRRFAGWQQAFGQRCRLAQWIDVSRLHLALIELIEAGHFALPASICFIGFDRPTPLEQRLAAALAARGVAAEFRAFFRVDRSSPSALPAVHAYADVDAECAAAVAWVAQRLTADPSCRLAIVAPDLAAVRDRLAYLLDDVLHPALIRPDGAELPRCFNFSLGQPLAAQPLVRLALDALALGGGARLEQARLSALLLAPGWSADSREADARARLDLALRRELPYFTSLPALIRLGQRRAATGAGEAPAGGDCPRTLAALQGLQASLAAAPRRLSPAAWSGVFRTALQALGWPGERPLSSREFQTRQAFAETLDHFAALDGLLGPVTQADAVRRLSQLCTQRIFQPETLGQPPVQILGVLESAGLQFDGLWVMGMNDDQWPPAPRPNPLLPAEALRAAGAAHASAEVELAFARAVQQRLRQAAAEQYYSFAQADGNRLRRPSPLLADLPAPPAASPAAGCPATLAQALALSAGAVLVACDDAVAPPVAAGERVAGGSWLLRAQAICPAWAFYQFRLAAEAMETPVEGLDPAARGTLVHAALEAFWRALGSSSVLAALTDAARTAAIEAAVAAAIAGFEAERRSPLPARFRQLEGARLQRLLARWLAVEAARALPFEVLACEAPAEVDIEGIRVRMVVDRIDRLADGRQVIIDYKTGAGIDTKNWAEARITEPQLPIYAALVNAEVAAVVFAKVLLDKPAFAGVAEEKDILPGVQGLDEEKRKLFAAERFPDWPAVIAHWQTALRQVAGEVRDGVAAVRFADESQLKYCDVLPLLRLPERRRLLARAMVAGDGR